MSIFSFPRLHFWGTQYVNPGTGNNNSLGPGTEITVTVNTEQVAPIDNALDDADFYAWMQGLDPNGLLRAQWNYFGDMSFRFGDANAANGQTGPAEFVKIVSAQLGPNDLRSDPTTEPLIGAEVRLRSAFVCDVNPEGFDCTQIFTGALEIIAPDALGGPGIFLSRRPTRACTRSLNWYRNASFHAAVDPTSGGAGGASASFIHSVRVLPGDLERVPDRGVEYDEMLHHWWPQDAPGKPRSPATDALHAALKQPGVRGLQIRYNLYLTYPRISDQALNKDFSAGIQTENPAIGWVLGTIAPWFEDEPESVTLGRYLKPARPYVNKYRKDGKPYYIAPAVAQFDKGSGVLSVDLINSLPEDGKGGEKFADLGDFSIGVRTATPPGTNPGENAAPVTAVGPVTNDKSYFERHGGIYDWVVTDPAVRTLLEDPGHELVLSSGMCGALLFEPEFFVASDCEAAYLDEAPPGSPEPIIRPKPRKHHRVDALCGSVPLYVRRRGQVPKGQVTLSVEQWKFTPSGDPRRPGFYVWPSQLGGADLLTIAGGYGMHKLNPVAGPGVRMFRYVAPGQWPQPMTGEQVGQLTFQEFYTFLRVLPYDAEAAAVSRGEVDYDAVYQHVFRYYALILPAMSKRLNMTAESGSAWATPTAAQYLLKTTDPDLWDHWAYMPRTRDLSSTRRELLRQFCRGILAGHSATSTQ